MKFAGTFILIFAVMGLAWAAALDVPDDRKWVLRLVRVALSFLFIAGLSLFGAGLKREIFAELRSGAPSPPR